MPSWYKSSFTSGTIRQVIESNGRDLFSAWTSDSTAWSLRSSLRSTKFVCPRLFFAHTPIRGWGIDPDIWQTVMAEPGRFQSAAVGGAESRKDYADACGSKWIADKRPIWLGDG